MDNTWISLGTTWRPLGTVWKLHGQIWGINWELHGHHLEQHGHNCGSILTHQWDNSETPLIQNWEKLWATLRQLWHNFDTTLSQVWQKFDTSLRPSKWGFEGPIRYRTALNNFSCPQAGWDCAIYVCFPQLLVSLERSTKKSMVASLPKPAFGLIEWPAFATRSKN